jgi:lipopolysaccharide transport system ATP-binding protein
MSSIIQVINLSKSYTITHEGRERYTALRDVVTQKAKKIFSFPAWRAKTIVTKEEFWALKDVSFDIEQGDRIGIIGRNGAGKSTLLKILSRITEPTTGSIKIKGRVASLLEVGTGFHPELTGRENIFLNGAILGMSRVEIRRHFDAIVDFAEVEKFLDTPVKRYSSGMYVRLAFAVAAHLEPEILVVDEVLAVGDAQFQKKCLGKMEDVSKNEGRTVLFVSHNMSAITNLCNRGILLNNGLVELEGDISKLVNNYSTKGMDLQKNTLVNNTAGMEWWINTVCLFQRQKICTNINVSEIIQLELEIEGRKKQKISLELLLKDANHNPILFIPLGLGQNINFECEAGKRVLMLDIKLPQLALGEYFFDIYIVESSIKRISTFQNAISFEVVSSYIVETGWSFDNNSNSLGCILGKIEKIAIK